ncbi:hypothetical protein ACFFMN_24205 [Planobispora siamensis]|uniref:Uncharacterized protein n=1 Tax=Planobispora siamensis TaxID=936338 RepID=A0A8J3SLY8_9ACTN|nr:hypothetical protein [Planobispora siamensis]GIH94795.1 hypothetical protein Psi01_54250 [Planobispora siamensis]
MAHSVFHRRYGIDLDLTEDDLGHPDRPGLLDELYRNYHPDLLYCLDPYEHDGMACPGFMTIRKKNGRPHAMHVPTGELKETGAQSDLHKALREYTARTADREGFTADVDERPANGRGRTDVVVTGEGGRKLGYEIQLSAIATGSVDKRTRMARSGGLTPLWLVNDENAMPIDRAPWARLNVFTWKDVGREALPVRGGVKKLRMVTCDWDNPSPCPQLGYGRCGGRHGSWEPARGLYYDDVIVKTASGDLVPLYMERADGRRRWYLWVTPADKEMFLQGRPEQTPPEAGGAVAGGREGAPLPRYRTDELLEELARPRDSGDPIDASDWLPAAPAEDYVTPRKSRGYLVPGDLIVLQRAYYEADARCAEISAGHPRPTDVAAGRAELTEEHRRELAEARERRLRLAEALNRHPWWGTIGNRHFGKLALTAAARSNRATRPAAM